MILYVVERVWEMEIVQLGASLDEKEAQKEVDRLADISIDAWITPYVFSEKAYIKFNE